MITYFIFTTALIALILILLFNSFWNEYGLGTFGTLSLWILISLLLSMIYDDYDIVETEIDKSKINYIVNDLDYSRIVIIPLEGNEENFDMGEATTKVYQDGYQIRKIDSLEFNFVHKEKHNMWGLKLNEKIDTEFK